MIFDRKVDRNIFDRKIARIIFTSIFLTGRLTEIYFNRNIVWQEYCLTGISSDRSIVYQEYCSDVSSFPILVMFSWSETFCFEENDFASVFIYIPSQLLPLVCVRDSSFKILVMSYSIPVALGFTWFFFFLFPLCPHCCCLAMTSLLPLVLFFFTLFFLPFLWIQLHGCFPNKLVFYNI